MKKVKNQCGFATLEIILAVAIVGIFSAVAVPKMARLVDKVCLDYEMKSLYSELNLARSVGKSSTVQPTIFYSNFADNQQQVEIWIYSKNYGTSTSTAKNRYQIMRPAISAAPRFYQHNLTKGIDLSFFHGDEILKISFHNPSRYSSGSRTLTLTSKFNYSAEIKFDTVGRWRGEYVK